MNAVFSTEKRLLVTQPDTGFARLVDLDLTVEFDGAVYNLILRGGFEEGQPAAIIAGAVRDAGQALTVATAYATATRLVRELELPGACVEQVLSILERDFGPRFKMWLQDTRSRDVGREEPIAPAPAVPTAPAAPQEPMVAVNGDVLVSVDRDLSEIFGQPEGTYRLEYTLFNEPNVFRCLLALHRGKEIKVLDFQKKEVHSIVLHLRSDNLAFEVASWFGNRDSHIVHLVGAALKLGCAFYTRPPGPMVIGPEISRRSEPDTPTVAISPVRRSAASSGECPIPLVPVNPTEKVEVYNGGYFTLRR